MYWYEVNHKWQRPHIRYLGVLKSDHLILIIFRQKVCNVMYDRFYSDIFIGVWFIRECFNNYSALEAITTVDNVAKVLDLVLPDRQLKMRQIVEIVGISKDSMGDILTPANEWPFHSSVWCCLSPIRRSFRDVSWTSMKHGFTGTYQLSRDSRKS